MRISWFYFPMWMLPEFFDNIKNFFTRLEHEIVFTGLQDFRNYRLHYFCNVWAHKLLKYCLVQYFLGPGEKIKLDTWSLFSIFSTLQGCPVFIMCCTGVVIPWPRKPIALVYQQPIWDTGRYEHYPLLVTYIGPVVGAGQIHWRKMSRARLLKLGMSIACYIEVGPQLV